MALTIELRSPAVPSNAEVLRYRWVSGISELFQLELEIQTEEFGLDLTAATGANVEVDLDDDMLPAVSGVCHEIVQLSCEPTGLSRYRVHIAPDIWLLTQNREQRIFQDRSVPEIVQDLCEEYAGGVSAPRFALGGSYAPREFTVQYDESDFDFVARLCADEGISFAFDHADKSRLVLLDDSSVDVVGHARVPFVPPADAGLVATKPHVLAATTAARVAPARVVVRDFDFRKADYKLEAVAERRGAGVVDVARAEYTMGAFSEDSSGKARGKRLLEEAQRDAKLVEWTSSFPVAAAGHLSVSDHPRDDLCGTFLVRRVESVVDGTRSTGTARHSVTAMPVGTPFRPPRRSKPVVAGTQTAIVVGDEGEEIDVDEHGRVKLRFFWDRRDIASGAPSCRVRVARTWAGGGYGILAMPRVGDEVVVSFLGGDPDQPMIVGSVHNSSSYAPLGLPAGKAQTMLMSKSTPGGDGANGITIDDTAGKELFAVKAQKNYTLDVGNDATIHVKNNMTETVDVNHTMTVGSAQDIKVGAKQTTNVTANQEIKVGASQITEVAAAISAKSATYALETGPLGMKGTSIGVTGSASIGLEAPMIGAHGLVAVTAEAPTVTVSASALAQTSAPLVVLQGMAMAVLQGGATAIVDGPEVAISGASKVSILGAEIVVDGASVSIKGGTVTVGDATVNIQGGTINIGGGTVNIN